MEAVQEIGVFLCLAVCEWEKNPFRKINSRNSCGEGAGRAASATRLKAAGTKLRFDIVRKAGLTSIY